MIGEKKVLALIPARSGSKGLPGKNIINLNGKSLLGWPIEASKNSQYIDKIVVSTDDELIAQTAQNFGAEIPFLRPAELATDESTSIVVIEHALMFFKEKGIDFDYLVFLEPTSPLTEATDINRALEALESNSLADSIVGVSLVESTHPVFDVSINKQGLIEPYLTKNFSSAGRRQEIEEVYFLDGSLYISDTSVLLQKRGFYHERTMPYIVPKWKAFEVDDLVDLLCIETIMKNKERIKAMK